MLKKVVIHDVVENTNPRFIKTKMVKAIREDNHELNWEIVDSHDSVHIIVDNIETRELLLVQQVRVPVLVRDGLDGVVIEACAGIIDKEKPLEQIALEEVEEELGYSPVGEIFKIREFKSSVGISGTTSHAFYVEVTEADKISQGGGLPEEDIVIFKLPYVDVKDFIEDQTIVTDAITVAMIMDWMYRKLN